MERHIKLIVPEYLTLDFYLSASVIYGWANMGKLKSMICALAVFKKSLVNLGVVDLWLCTHFFKFSAKG